MPAEGSQYGFALCIVLLLAVPAGAQRPGEPLATGPWGGDGMLLLVSAEGASAEFNCAHGETSERIDFGENRRFQVNGWIVEEGGAAAQEDRKSAVFTGRLRRDVLTVTVRYGSEPKELGPFELRQGGNARVAKCQ